MEWGNLAGAPRRLAAALGIKEASVSRWRGGAPISEELQPKVAKLLGVSLLTLSSSRHEDAPPGIDTASIIREAGELPRIPVLGVVSADRFSFSFDAFPEDHLPIPMERGRRLFALRISGDCMEPTFRDKDYVILSEMQQVHDGRVVLAQLDGEFTLKRYFLKADGVELRPDNPKYKTIKVASKALVIRGVVVGTYRRDI